MEKTDSIKVKIDSFYKGYVKNNYSLSNDDNKEVAKLLVSLSNSTDETEYIIEMLSKFSLDVVTSYFETITRINAISIETIDYILTEYMKINKKEKLVGKYSAAIKVIMNNLKSAALVSKELPELVAVVSRYYGNQKHKKRFPNLVKETSGKIYLLNYSNIDVESLENIWRVTQDIFPEIQKQKYKEYVVEWATKYGFMKNSNAENESTDKTVETDKALNTHIEKEIHSEETTETIADATDSIKSDNKGTYPADNTTHTESGIKEPVKTQEETELTDVKEESVKLQNNDNSALDSVAKKLFISVSRNIKQEHDAISTQLNDLLLPISKSIETINVEIKKSRDVAFENTSLKNRISELEKQLAEQKAINQKTEQDLFTSNAELKETKLKIEILESNNAELDAKLADAYSINSRESSLEAEKIRSELKKSFSFLYEDWLDYEFSDATEDNYESLQAIIKKIFRSLERNGIDFKGNN